MLGSEILSARWVHRPPRKISTSQGAPIQLPVVVTGVLHTIMQWWRWRELLLLKNRLLPWPWRISACLAVACAQPCGGCSQSRWEEQSCQQGSRRRFCQLGLLFVALPARCIIKYMSCTKRNHETGTLLRIVQSCCCLVSITWISTYIVGKKKIRCGQAVET